MRIRVFLLALVGMLLVCLPLFAVDEVPFSVGLFVLQEDSDSFLQLVGEAGSTYANQFLIPSDAYKTHLSDKQQQTSNLATLKSISVAYASKSEKDVKKARELPLDPVTSLSDRLPIIYRSIPYNEGYASLLQTHPGSRPWYVSKENLDAIILLKKTKLASNDRLRLYWYDLYADTITLIFDKVMVQNDPSEMLVEIGAALLTKTAGTEYGLLVFDDYSSSVSLSVNNEPLVSDMKQELFASGKYTVRVFGEGFVPRQMEVTIQPNTITHMGTTLEREEGEDIHLFSSLGKVNWYVDGLFYDTTCALDISSSMVPLVIVAQKEGFASKTVQVHTLVKEIEVRLQPEWMVNSALQGEEQKVFYKSLRNTMLAFGLYVASITLANTFDSANPLWQPLQVATSGFALVSTLDTIMNLASYVALAGSGVR